MKKIILTATAFLLFLGNTLAQIVTTTPALPTDQGEVTIVFDASQGNAGLKDYTGDVYAHTGVTTNLGAWQHVIAEWAVNNPKVLMTSKGNNKYELKLSPSIREFYGVLATEKISQLDFVFRSSDGKKIT